jgi:hypothetical protein
MSKLGAFGMALMMEMLLRSTGTDTYDDGLDILVKRVCRNPWDDVHLTKAERRGKTYDDMQVLRKEKYETENNPSGTIKE